MLENRLKTSKKAIPHTANSGHKNQIFKFIGTTQIFVVICVFCVLNILLFSFHERKPFNQNFSFRLVSDFYCSLSSEDTSKQTTANFPIWSGSKEQKNENVHQSNSEYSKHNCLFQAEPDKAPISHTVSCHLENVCFNTKKKEFIVFEGEDKRPFMFFDNAPYEKDVKYPIEIEFNPDVTWLRGPPWFEPYQRINITKFDGSKSKFLKSLPKEYSIMEIPTENNVILEQIDQKNVGHVLIDDLYTIFLMLKKFQYQHRILPLKDSKDSKSQQKTGMNVIFTENCEGRILKKRSCNGKDEKCLQFAQYRPVCKRLHEVFNPLLGKSEEGSGSAERGQILYLDEMTKKTDVVCFQKNLFVGSGQLAMHNYGILNFGAPILIYDFLKWYKKAILTQNLKKEKEIKSFFPNNGKKNLLLAVKKGSHKSGCSNEKLTQALMKLYEKDPRVNVVSLQYSGYSLEEQVRLTNEVDVMVAPRGAASVMGLFMKNGGNIIILDDNIKYEAYFWSHISHVRKAWCFNCCIFNAETVRKTNNLIELAMKN